MSHSVTITLAPALAATTSSAPLKLEITASSTSGSVKQAIRSHFHLADDAGILLVDSEGCDVVADPTLPPGQYELQVGKHHKNEDKDVEMKTEETAKPAPKKKPATYSQEQKWAHLVPILTRTSPFAPSSFKPGVDTLDYIGEEVRVLVVGAGGLGCELLKDLALSGFKDIEVIDMDTIDVSNLNRQFLFRLKDTGKYKADVAAAFINKRIKGAKVKAHTDNIQAFGKEWYRRFNIVIAGLDNIEARDWLNKTLIDMVEFDEDGNVNYDTLIPLIDGGTTGFSGQARVVIPYQTACYHCTLASLPPEEGFHLCTIASKPRKPEHCIAYALMVDWPRLKSFTNSKVYELGPPPSIDEAGNPQVEEGKIKLNKDDPQHMTFILERALERAQKFDIKGVTYFMAMQVVKNIIPALASTNAIISAACVNEALKIMTQSYPRLNSYFQYYADAGVSCRTFPYARDPECDVCTSPLTWKLKPSDTLGVLLEKVKKLFPPAEGEKDDKGPTLSLTDGTILYINVPGMDYTENLTQPLFASGVVDKTMIITTNGQRTRRIMIKFGK